MKWLIMFLLSSWVLASSAQVAVYHVAFKDTDNMKFMGERDVVIYPLSERAKPMVESNLQRHVKAADYASGIIVKTDKPEQAAQEILHQISTQTGEKIGPFQNSVLKKAAPTAILMGASKTSVWQVVLSPAQKGDYVLTISYLIKASLKDK